MNDYSSDYHQGSVFRNVSLEEKNRSSFLSIESKKPKSRSLTAASWLLAPLCPRPSFLPFVPFYHSSDASFRRLSSIHFAHKILSSSFARDLSGPPRHYRVFTVFCLRRLVILCGRERNGSFAPTLDAPGTRCRHFSRLIRTILSRMIY